MIKREVVRLPSRRPDGSLMYPGLWLLTWFKPLHLPWVLVGIEPAPDA